MVAPCFAAASGLVCLSLGVIVCAETSSTNVGSDTRCTRSRRLLYPCCPPRRRAVVTEPLTVETHPLDPLCCVMLQNEGAGPRGAGASSSVLAGGWGRGSRLGAQRGAPARRRRRARAEAAAVPSAERRPLLSALERPGPFPPQELPQEGGGGERAAAATARESAWLLAWPSSVAA